MVRRDAEIRRPFVPMTLLPRRTIIGYQADALTMTGPGRQLDRSRPDRE